MLRKVLPPESRNIASVASEMGVDQGSIRRWIKQIKDGKLNIEQEDESPSSQRNMSEKLNLLLESQKHEEAYEYRTVGSS